MPLYVTSPRYDGWLLILLGGVIALTLVLGAVMVAMEEWTAAGVVFVVIAFDAILLWAVLPRRYEVWPERFRIVMGGPFALNIPLETITEVRPARAADTLAYWGLRFGTSVRTPVEIRRRRGFNVIVCPRDRRDLIDRLREALDACRGQGASSA